MAAQKRSWIISRYSCSWGNMSLIGPRPELRKYVGYYDNRQRMVLEVKSGIAEPASLESINEEELLTNKSRFPAFLPHEYCRER